MSKKTTKRALAMSFVSVFLCVCMLVGTTFAWFTDSVTSSNNVIKSGKLDVEMSWADGKTDPANTTWKDASQGAIFNYDKWEPGYVEVRHIKIENKGTLALKYQLNIIANGEVSDLADVIDVYYADPAEQVATRDALDGKTPMGTLTQALAGMSTTASGNLKAGESDTITIALKMQESATNEYQNKSIGSAFAVQLLATQLTYEKDSFDELYDQNAGYAVEVNSADALADALRGGGLVKLTGDIAVTESMTVPAGATAVLDLNGNEITAAFAKGAGAVLTNNGTLTIKDGTIKNTVTNGDAAIRNKGTLTLDGAEIVGAPIADGGYPSYALDNYGKLTVEDGSSITSDRGAIYMNDGSDVAINGGNIAVTDTLGTRVLTAHVIYAKGSNSKLTINDGNFALNYAAAGDTGASVICPAGATIDVYGGNFSYAGTTGGQSGIFQNYMGYSASLVNIYGGTYNDTTFNGSYYHNPLLATGYEATDNGDGTWTVGPKKITVSNATDIAAGGAFELTEDVTYDSDISNDVTIDLNGKTFEATYSYELKDNADLTMTGGNYEVNGTYGHVDVRPSTAEGSEVVFEDVNFSYNKLGPTYGTCTNRLGSVVEVCATVADAKSVVIFKNCTFNNAQVVIEGMSSKTGVVDVTFENCTFNALTSSAPIEVMNYVKGTIKVVGCTFNLECTSSLASAIDVTNNPSTAVTVTAENNTINAVAATPTDSSVTGVDVVKVNGTPANIKFISISGTTSSATETGTVKTGIAG